MNIVLILLATLAATTLYAIANYFLSIQLSSLTSDMQAQNDLNGSDPATAVKDVEWFLIHYLFGLLFVSGYYFFWISKEHYISWTSGIIFGAIIGIIGVIARGILYRTAGIKVPLNRKSYYFQFLVTQLIFGLTTVLIYQIIP